MYCFLMLHKIIIHTNTTLFIQIMCTSLQKDELCYKACYIYREDEEANLVNMCEIWRQPSMHTKYGGFYYGR